MGELILVILLVAGAVYFAARTLYRTLSGKDHSGCGSCPGGACPGADHCPSAQDAKSHRDAR
jgi:hypothetical protein